MLRLLAVIVVLAGVAFVGQALARSAATIGNDAQALRGLGHDTRRELVAAGLGPHLLTAGVAVVIAVVTAPLSPPDGSRSGWQRPSITPAGSGSTFALVIVAAVLYRRGHLVGGRAG